MSRVPRPSCRRPRLPIHVPRPATAMMSPRGVTRLRAGPSALTCRPGRLSLHDDRIADVHHVEVPGGVVRAEVDATVADVCITLGIHRPGCRMYVDTAPGDPDRVLPVEQ